MNNERRIDAPESKEWVSREEDENFFNQNFPAVNGWWKVIVRENNDERSFMDQVFGTKPIPKNAKRFEVIVETQPGPKSELEKSEVFVAFYREGDLEGRDRVEKIMNEIYPIFAKKGELN